MSPGRPEDEIAAVEAAAIAAGEEVLSRTDPATEAAVRAQMDSLYRRDVCMAWGLVIFMLIVVPYVYFSLLQHMPNAGTKIVLAAAAGVLLLYNVASMLALVRNYKRDRDFIYRRDVAHLREQRAARQAMKAAR